MRSQLWWYTARSSGLVAWALLAGSMLWGLALSTKVFGKRSRPAWLLDLHRFLGGAAANFIVIHVVSIMLDSYVHFGPVDVLVPLTGSWHPLAVAWGIVSMYLLVAVEVTSLLRRRLSKQVWRMTHYLSFPLFVTATVHSLSAGTDRATFIMRWAVLSTAAAVTILTAVRVRQADQHDVMSPPRIPPSTIPASRIPGVDARRDRQVPR
jgi:predicted ferric reductase